ncbi:hypothetical protein M9Y10_027010 [Tritrichomonas musculus]|uniref:Major facilitator superfamily transporter n=1 Tax=Tritrichomonas musculus TaxID=1915356 RepID=A0ABR2H592_9EUKA
MGNLNNFITRICIKSKIALNIIALAAGFLTYFCMYAFRKPFSAGTYSGYSLFGIQFKILGLTLQILGYTLSKFLGIKVISEMTPKRRGIYLILFMTSSEVALILFGAIPAPYNVFCMFLVGLPLGMVWGVAFSYLEGRKTSELLGSGMAVSFIVSSGIIKSIGANLLNAGLPQFWMPATVGAIFWVPMCLAVAILESLPPPDEEDIACRTERVTMDRNDRREFFKFFAPGLVAMIIFFMFLTAYRDFRDNFAPELWQAFGYGEAPSIFSISEIIVAFVVCVPVISFMFIKSKLNILISYHILIIIGQLFIALFAYLETKGVVKGLYYMIVAGIGLYFGYVPFNSIIFDAFIAAYHYRANTGFVSYLCQAFGNLSCVVIMLVKNFGSKEMSWLSFFNMLTYCNAVIATISLAFSLGYCIWKYKQVKATLPETSEEEDDDDRDNIIILKNKKFENDETDNSRITATIDDNLDDIVTKDNDSDSPEASMSMVDSSDHSEHLDAI